MQINGLYREFLPLFWSIRNYSSFTIASIVAYIWLNNGSFAFRWQIINLLSNYRNSKLERSRLWIQFGSVSTVVLSLFLSDSLRSEKVSLRILLILYCRTRDPSDVLSIYLIQVPIVFEKLDRSFDFDCQF